MIKGEEYDRMRSWFASISREVFGPFTAETDPIAALDQLCAKSPAQARQGLAMAVNDLIEATGGWSDSQVAAADQTLSAQELPTLSEIRARFSKTVRSVIRRGEIKNEVEYHAVRNAVELTSDADRLWKLLAEYESRTATGS
jgi:hypothetical protein